MVKHVRGAVGTALLWSGPSAFLALLFLVRTQTGGERLTDLFAQLLLNGAAATIFTAPIGSWLRRGTRWTPEARLQRRNARSLTKVTVFDAGFCLGIAYVSYEFISVLPAMVPLAKKLWPEPADVDGNLSKVALVILFVALLVIGTVMFVQLNVLLIGGLWRRTVWGRRRSADRATDPTESDTEDNPSPDSGAGADTTV